MKWNDNPDLIIKGRILLPRKATCMGCFHSTDHARPMIRTIRNHTEELCVVIQNAQRSGVRIGSSYIDALTLLSDLNERLERRAGDKPTVSTARLETIQQHVNTLSQPPAAAVEQEGNVQARTSGSR